MWYENVWMWLFCAIAATGLVQQWITGRYKKLTDNLMSDNDKLIAENKRLNEFIDFSGGGKAVWKVTIVETTDREYRVDIPSAIIHTKLDEDGGPCMTIVPVSHTHSTHCNHT